MFQSVYQPASGGLGNLPLMPEWHLFGLAFAALAALGLDWPPLGFFFPLLLLSFGVSLLQAGLSAAHAPFTGTLGTPPARLARLKLTAITGSLHLLQPLARLSGRLNFGFFGTPRRRRSSPRREITGPVGIRPPPWSGSRAPASASTSPSAI